jgi:hypothetical protein
MAEHFSDIIETVVALLDDFDNCFLELAKLLRWAQDEDRRLFKKLIALPKLGQRKAYYLSQIHRALDGYPIDPSVLVAVGWTKLSIVAPYVSATSIFELLDLAQTYNAHQLAAIVKGQDPIENARVVQLYLTAEQYQSYADVLVEHGGAKKKGIGLEGAEQALMAVIAKVEAFTVADE